MICPKGYTMGPNGVCQQSNEYAVGGPLRKKRKNQLDDCYSQCDDLQEQIVSCNTSNVPCCGPECHCVPWHPGTGWSEYQCWWTGMAPGQCYINCTTGGLRGAIPGGTGFGGYYGGYTGTGRQQKGGIIKKRRGGK